MPVSRYRLTLTGWIGAALFVLPTPIATWKYFATIKSFEERGEYQRTLEQIQGGIPAPDFSPTFFTALATASLIGLVLLLIGREIETVG